MARALRSEPWRGNVRKFQNVMEHAVVLLKLGAEIRPDDTPPPWASNPVPYPSDIMEEGYHAGRDRPGAESDGRWLKRLVNRAGGSRSKAAQIARVDETTRYRLADGEAQAARYPRSHGTVNLEVR